MTQSFKKLKVLRMALQREILRHQDDADLARKKAKELEIQLRQLDVRRSAFTDALQKHRLLLHSEVDASYRQQLDTELQDKKGLEQRHDKFTQTLHHHERCISSRLESVRRNQQRHLLAQQVDYYRLQLSRDVETVALRHQRERTRD